MPVTNQLGVRVVYVGCALHELPRSVQDWLVRNDCRAEPSPNIFDTLALLATGKKTDALLVNLDALDWNELEFFELAATLCRGTRIFVIGGEHQKAKLEAACRCGAEVLEAEALREVPVMKPVSEPEPGLGGLLAGALRPAGVYAKPAAPLEAPPPRTKPAKSAVPSGPPQPPVRLVRPCETEEDHEAPVPFPWSPAANRPQRVPPQSPAPAKEAAGSAFNNVPPPAEPARPTIQLTPEELDALTGELKNAQSTPLKEQRQC